jgi:hypothetical protein
MTISLDKKYRTRDGRDVRIYAMDHNGDYPIIGATIDSGYPNTCSWKLNGWAYDSVKSELDLVEVKPRIKRTVWLNIYAEYPTQVRESKEAANASASSTRIACVQVEIDCEEGEGL